MAMTRPDTTPLNTTVSENVRQLLADRAMSLQELSRRMNRSGAWSHHKVTGMSRWTVDEIHQVAVIFDVPPIVLMQPVTRKWRAPGPKAA